MKQNDAANVDDTDYDNISKLFRTGARNLSDGLTGTGTDAGKINEAHNAISAARRKMDSVGFDINYLAVYDTRRVVGGGAVTAPFVMMALKDKKINALTVEISKKDSRIAELERLLAIATGNKKPSAKPVVKPNTKSASANQKRSDGFQWTPEQYQTALQMLFDGRGVPAIRRAFPLLTLGGANRKFCNDPPDEELLGFIIEVHTDNREMSFLELCKIGHALYGDVWKGQMAQRFGLSRNHIQWNEPTWLKPKDRVLLRNEWRVESIETIDGAKKFIAAVVKESGSRGLTKKEIQSKRPNDKTFSRRWSDLLREGTVFEVGERLVHRTFQDDHPAAYNAAEKKRLRRLS